MHGICAATAGVLGNWVDFWDLNVSWAKRVWTNGLLNNNGLWTKINNNNIKINK